MTFPEDWLFELNSWFDPNKIVGHAVVLIQISIFSCTKLKEFFLVHEKLNILTVPYPVKTYLTS